ncbi:hypothetical protein LEN26_018604 [Aphanomyces euteiches]|nr:hypothetical protein LEN26_018604 [Aphanomyces euteiches]KAH9114072.1 hypothetical protein AeMF1_011817 [Aphanomyces euteiches]KAH9189515.1 hypothetical protein AeNC1_008511 [Aphanomyces euteiches]
MPASSYTINVKPQTEPTPTSMQSSKREGSFNAENKPRRSSSVRVLPVLEDEDALHWLGGRVTIYAPMVMRNPKEEHRVSSALEKLFDLTLVVALSAVSKQFATNIQYGTADMVHQTLVFIISFFTTWNTWFPYVWFATTYDTDDILFRLGTFGEMIGILMISDGIAHNESEVVVGYIVLRFFHGFFFRFRAAYQDPQRREVNFKHGMLSTIIMVCWYFQQTYATTFLSQVLGFGALAFCDLAYPYVSQRTTHPSKRTKYHAHHVSERYSEFTIIVFGESILSLSHATVLKSTTFNMEALSTCIASMSLLFMLWWIYFLVPFGQILHDKPSLTYTVAYGHFFIHAPLAAFASGIYIVALGTQAGGTSHEEENNHGSTETVDGAISISTAAFVIAISVSIFLMSIPLILSLPSKVVVRNLIASIAMCIVATLAPGHVSASALMWLFCSPVLIVLLIILLSYRKKK